MASSWRIRHKLVLGMGLVVTIMALLLGGTIKGLTTYKATLRVIEAKFNELEEVDRLRAAVKALGEPLFSPDPPKELKEGRIPPAREALVKYHTKLQDAATRTKNPNYGYRELNQVQALEGAFAKLDAAVHRFLQPGVFANSEILRDGDIRQAIQQLVTTTDDLIDTIYKEVDQTIVRSVMQKKEFNFALGFIVTTTIGALLIMFGLLRFFYRGVFHPISELGLGVKRVAKGDFEHPIQISTGDELEELAGAFNEMTGKLHAMYSDLAQQVNERSRQLVRSERLAGVGFLAAGVAHEINNPLASIAFCSEALESRLTELFDRAGDPTERDIVGKYLKMIQEEAFRCKEITQKLLAFSRGGERKREQGQLDDIVQSVLDMVQHLQSAKGKELVYEATQPIAGWFNAQEIKQVFLNLVVNALESMDEGGKLTITQTVKDGMGEVTFKDTGCGMEAEILENIFEPFFTRSRTGKGTGLGLSISHRIINQHGGEIEADSAGPGQGSTFVVRLPLDAPSHAGESSDVGPDPEEEFLKLSTAQRERRAA